jgi:YHS domain-containing protein
MPIDPVCKRRLEITEAAASYDYHSWTVYFCSLECWKKFEKDPEGHMHTVCDEELLAA